MRRLRKILAVTTIVLALVFVPRAGSRDALRFLRAQIVYAQNKAVAAVSPARIADAEGNLSQAPIVVANAVPVRALAVNAFTSAAANSNLAASVYFTETNQPNQVLTLNSPVALNALVAAFHNVAGIGQAGSLGDGGAATSAQLDLKLDSLTERSGIAIAADGTIFIADTLNSTIRRIAGPESTEPGIIRSVAGRYASAENVTLSEPLGIALDRLGNLYIADHAANAVIVQRAATSDMQGSLEIFAQVVSPASIAVTPGGEKVFVASPETGSVFVINAQTRAIKAISLPKSGAENTAVIPAGLAADAFGNLFIADAAGNQILRVDAATGKITSVATNLNTPGDLALDASGNLFITDQARQQVLVAEAAAGSTCATSASNNVTLCFSTGANAFAVTPTGGSTSTVAFTITNNSAVTLTGLGNNFGGANPGDFLVQSSSCLTTLAANASCSLNVLFAPAAVGARAATLNVTDSNPLDAVSAALSGTGYDYQIQLASGQNQSVTVDQGSTATFNLQIAPDTNFTGTTSVTIVCPTNLPIFTACVPSANPVVISAGAATKFTLKIETTSNAGVLSSKVMPLGPAGRAPQGPGNPMRFPALILVFVALLIACVLVSFPRSVRLFTKSKYAHLKVAATKANPSHGGGFVAAAFRPASLGLIRRWCAAMTLFVLIGVALSGCHHGVANGTPGGTTSLIINGTTEGASRGITISVSIIQ